MHTYYEHEQIVARKLEEGIPVISDIRGHEGFTIGREDVGTLIGVKGTYGTPRWDHRGHLLFPEDMSGTILELEGGRKITLDVPKEAMVWFLAQRRDALNVSTDPSSAKISGGQYGLEVPYLQTTFDAQCEKGFYLGAPAASFHLGVSFRGFFPENAAPQAAPQTYDIGFE